MLLKSPLNVRGDPGVIRAIATVYDIDAVFSVRHEYQLRTTRLLDGGNFSRISDGRIARGSKLPPQFGNASKRMSPTQKVHSKL